VLTGAITPAGAVDPVASPGPDAAFDLRTAGRPAAPAPPPAATRAARSRLTERLGPAAVLDVDPETGTARRVQDLGGGALSGPAAGDRAAVARRFARANAGALGLDAGDVDALEDPERVEGPAGSILLRFGQSAGGLPVLGAELRVVVDRAGRVLSAGGAPLPDLRAPAGGPKIGAAEALRRAGAPGGSGDARLLIFAAGEPRLAWRVIAERSSTEVLDVVVDAGTGAVLRRANLVEHAAEADVFEHHPGAPGDEAAETVDLEARGYLPGGAQVLAGPVTRAYADLDGDDRPGAGEDVVRAAGEGFRRPFTRFTGGESRCTESAFCSWDRLVAGSWRENREQATVQAFYAVSRFAEHLRSPAIGFDGFRGDDPIVVEADDGAAKGTDGIPPAAHRNNANMYTPPDGQSPRMQLYLFGGPGSGQRDVNSADDTAVVFHEHTHGLSSRLVTDESGVQALNGPHAGALGEAWSDWYAQDRLAREGSVADALDTPGEVRLGRYYGGGGRRQALDCPVGAPAGACPGAGADNAGGFTFGDFGRIVGRAEVHYDGEIWGETLWDLRTALVRRLGSEEAGSDAAETLVTGGMRLTPPEPSFLDARDAILAADQAAGGALRDVIWSVFAARGMGFYAAVEDSADVAPVEDFSPPPDPAAPRGTVTGRVIDEVSGLPLEGISVAFGGHASTLAARTGSGGAYRIEGVPAGRYPKLLLRGRPGHDPHVETGVEVAGGATTVRDVRLRRNWAARGAGARKTAAANEPYDAQYSCGADEAIDEQRGTAWLSVNPTGHPTYPEASLTVELPETIDVRAFGMDPRTGCHAALSSSTRAFRLETSPDGVTWSEALSGRFADQDAGRLNVREPAAAARGVRFVRLTLLEAFDEREGRAGRTFIGFSELAVYGAAPNRLPAGPLSATPARVAPGETVRLDSGAIRDPDSAITGYEWDFDGDGRVERTTSEPATEIAYPAPGTPAPRVFARDFRGGAGTAATPVEVVAPAPARTDPTGPTGPSAPPPLPPAPPPAPPGGNVLGQTERSPAPPTLSVGARGTRGRVAVRATCAARCTVTGRLTADSALARRLGGSRVLGRLSVGLGAAGTRRASLALPARTRARLRRLGRRSVRLAARVTVRDAAGGSRTVTRRVTVAL